MENLFSYYKAFPKEIITHGSKAHEDDFMATCLALALYPTVSKITRKNDLTWSELLDERKIKIDVGGLHSPVRRAFDHHTDEIKTHCAATLLLRAQRFPEKEALEAFLPLEEMQFKDNYGLKALLRKNLKGIKTHLPTMKINDIANDLRVYMSPILSVLLRLFSTAERIDSGSSQFEMMKAIGAEFMLSISRRIERLSLLRRKATIHFVNSGGIMYPIIVFVATREDPSFMLDRHLSLELPNFKDDIVGSITLDPRGKGFGFYRYDKFRDLVDFNNLRMKKPMSFIHKGGFYATTQRETDINKALKLFAGAFNK